MIEADEVTTMMVASLRLEFDGVMDQLLRATTAQRVHLYEEAERLLALMSAVKYGWTTPERVTPLLQCKIIPKP